MPPETIGGEVVELVKSELSSEEGIPRGGPRSESTTVLSSWVERHMKLIPYWLYLKLDGTWRGGWYPIQLGKGSKG